MSFLKLAETQEVNEEINDFDYEKHIIKKDYINSRLNDYIHGRIPKGYGIKQPLLDNVIVCKINEMVACVGKKGRGKTTIEEILFLMWAMANNLNFVIALQENDEALEKMNLLAYIFGKSAKDVENEDKELFKKGVKWMDEHFIFIDVESFKEALDTTKGIINSGKQVAGLFLDPVNSFDNGWLNTGNVHEDEKKASKKMLKFSKEVCSIFLSQHPTMAGQRQTEDINSYSAEGGNYLNKAHFTWAINRDNGSSVNRISVDNIRNKYTGGGVTHPDSPLLLHWSPFKIDIEHEGQRLDDVVQLIRRRFNPLKEVFTDTNIYEQEKEILTVSPTDAFGTYEEVPF
tara:strand:+ start:34673 stop:35704 length:1032 start_codon:yes stop_codon:yes gene_type:complete